MEISSFPNFLSSTDDFSTQFYSSSFSELDPILPLKRRRIDDEILDEDPNGNLNESNSAAIKEILASLFMADDEEERENQQQWLFSSDSYQQSIETHLESKPNSMNNSFDPESSDYSRQKNKRTRFSGARGSISSSSAGVPADSGVAPVTHQRRLWVKDRSKDWWEKCSHPDFPEEEFRKAFRMSKATFDMICEELDPIITKKDTALRAAIPVRHRVAVCIWRLATGEPLRLVSKRFGLGISTCHKLVLEVCAAIKNSLMPKFLHWPDPTRIARVKEQFESISGIPNVGGSMYTTHIPIIAPKTSVAAYFNKRHTDRNQKPSYSVTIQGVVDSDGVFTDVCIGWPGSMPDDQVLEKSVLFQRAARGMLNNMWVVGTIGYPLMDWVLVPYTRQNIPWAQHTFNEKIGEIQKIATGAFWRLKARWGCLQKRTEVKVQELPVVLGACCVLHNICEMRNEAIDPELEVAFELFDDEMVPENPIRSATAAQARDRIAHDLLHHGLGATSSFL